MMRLPARIKAAVLDFILRVAPPRPVNGEEIRRADWSTHPGGKGLRFTARLRDRLRRRWLRISR